MGHTLTQWKTRVSALLRDETNVDVDDTALEATGLRPAIAQYSVDQAATNITEVPGAGSSYLALPVGWEPGVSRLVDVEYPARGNPPQMLDSQSWTIVRDPTDVTVEQLLILGSTPAAGQYVRLSVEGPWPYPTADPADDVIGNLAFEAVCHLAASQCCVALAGAAARARAGALPTDFADGRDRSRLLLEAAKRYRAVYEAFLGLASSSGDSGGDGSSSPPAFGRFDYDPGGGSLFHGGRR